MTVQTGGLRRNSDNSLRRNWGDITYVIGNGPSRRNINLEALCGVIWGCNALYRDFAPDYLVVADKRMQDEIIRKKYYENNKVFFQINASHRLPNSPNILTWQQHKKSPNNSGVAALYFALKSGATNIYLIGFDIINPSVLAHWNMYAQTENYKRPVPKVRRETPKKIADWAFRNPGIITRVIDPDTCWYPNNPKTINNGAVPYPLLNALEGFKEPYMYHITVEDFNNDR